MKKLQTELISFLVALVAFALVIFKVADSSLMNTWSMIGLPVVLIIVQSFLAIFNGRRYWVGMFPAILFGYILYSVWVSNSELSFVEMPFVIAEGLWIGIFAISIEAVFSFVMTWASFKPEPADDSDPLTESPASLS